MENTVFSTPVSRRTIAKGAAWSVPALVVANTAHAAAASPCIEDGTGVCTPIVLQIKGACKHPGESQGGKAYHVPLCFKDLGKTGGTVQIIDFQATGGKITGTEIDDTSITVTPGGETCVVAHFDSDSSANISLTVTYSVTYNGQTVNVQQTVLIPTFPPCPKGTP